MALDRRFWSGVVIAVTVVIAGANALPSLLLGPAPADDIPSVDAIPLRQPEPDPAPMVATPLPQIPKPEPPVLAGQVTPLVTPMPERPATPVPQATPVAEPVPAPAPEPAPARENAAAFPPVQPPSTEPPAPPVSVSRPAHAATEPSQEKAARAERPDRAERRKAARPRPVRPAIYPLREFFAWKR